MRRVVAGLFVTGLVLAALGSFSVNGPSVTIGGNFLRLDQFATPGTGVTQNYFVDGALGSDAASCKSSGTGACATVPGSLSKIPKVIRDLTTLTIASGNYGGFVVSGFSTDESYTTTSAGLLIQGTLANSTLASGTNSGTATGGTPGSGQTFGTLIDTGSGGWTVNDLTGRLLCTSNSNPANSCFPIESNTSTTVTIVGGNGVAGFVTPINGTTYTISDSATIINTAATLTGTPFAAAQTNRAGIIAIDNGSLGGRAGFITFKNIMVANSTGNFGVVFGGLGSYALVQMQVRPTGNSAAVSGSGAASSNPNPGAPTLLIQSSDIYLASPSTSSVVNWGSLMPLTGLGVQIRGNSTSAAQFGLLAIGPPSFSEWEITGTTNGLWLFGTGVGTSLNSGRINCSTYVSSTAFTIGNSTTVAGVAGILVQTGVGPIDHVNITVCDTGLLVDGAASAEVHGLTGSVGSQLIHVMNGGYVGVNQVNLTPASVTVGDGGPNVDLFVNLDGTVVTDAGTDLGVTQNLNKCLVSPQGSIACGR